MGKKLLNRKGFSLTEVVVAMALIVLVTISALTIVTSSINLTKKAISLSRAQYFAADSLEAFRTAEDADQFEEILAFAGGYSSLEKEDGKLLYQLENSGYTAEITLVYPDTDRSDFSIVITDESGNEVLQYAFRKGDSR